MKLLRKIILSLVLIFIIMSVTFVLLIRPYSRETINCNYDEFSFEKVIENTELNVYGTNKVTIQESELNNFISSEILSNIDDYQFPSYLKLGGISLNLSSNSIKVNITGKIYFLPIVFKIDVLPILSDSNIGFKVNCLHLGKIPLPISIISKSGLKIDNNTYYIYELSKFDEITFKKISVYNDNLQIDFETNNKLIIQKYVDNEYKQLAEELLILLNKNMKTKKLANDVAYAFLIYSIEDEIADELINQIKNDFNSLDNTTKQELFYNVIKYGSNSFMNSIFN